MKRHVITVLLFVSVFAQRSIAEELAQDWLKIRQAEAAVQPNLEVVGLRSELDVAKKQVKELSDKLNKINALSPRTVLLVEKAVRDTSATFVFQTDITGRIRVHLHRGNADEQQKTSAFGEKLTLSFASLAASTDYFLEAFVVGADDLDQPETRTSTSIMKFKTLDQIDAPVVSDWKFTPKMTPSGVIADLQVKINQDAMLVIECLVRESGDSSRYTPVSSKGEIRFDGLGNPTAGILTQGLQRYQFALSFGLEYGFRARAVNRVGKASALDPALFTPDRTPAAPGDFRITDEGVAFTFNALETVLSWKTTTPGSSGSVSATAKGAPGKWEDLDVKPDNSGLFRASIPYKKLKDLFGGTEDPILSLSVKDSLGRSQTLAIKLAFSLPTKAQVATAASSKTITAAEKDQMIGVIDGAKKSGKIKWGDLVSTALPILARIFIP